jgi:hypothetical protein
MASRYDNREVFENSEEVYEELIESRGKKKIYHYSTATIKHPEAKDFKNLTTLRHIWKVGDRFYKLSNKYYGSTKYWWVISIFNKKPTEADVSLGEELTIPLPLDKAMEIVKGR